MHFAFNEFAHILWGVKNPTIVMTDNKALTRFFQSKQRPPKLWNYCDQALQFDFVLAHVPGIENPAADYLSRSDINPNDSVHLKLHDEKPVFKVETDLASKTTKQDDDEKEYIPEDKDVRFRSVWPSTWRNWAAHGSACASNSTQTLWKRNGDEAARIYPTTSQKCMERRRASHPEHLPNKHNGECPPGPGSIGARQTDAPQQTPHK